MTAFRILMVAACPFPARRGTPVRIERLAQHLAKTGHQVDLVTYPVGETDQIPGVSVHRIGPFEQGSIPPGPTVQKLLNYDPRLARKIKAMLKAKRYDVIHAHHVEGVLAAAWARRGRAIPLIFDVHTMLGMELPFYSGGPIKAATRLAGNWFDRWLPSLADHMVVVTKDIRNQLMLQHNIPGSRVTVAMNGVEIEQFIHHSDYSAGADELIYTGTLAAYQGIDDLLDGFALAYRQRQSLRLTIVASDPFSPFEAKAKELGIMDAITVIEDDFNLLPERLAKAGVALIPRADCDGIPQKLLNYLAAGRPVVSFEGSAKFAFHNKAGLVVPNRNVVGFADAILDLAENPERARMLGEAGRVMAETQFSWTGTAATCEAAYRRSGAISSIRHPVSLEATSQSAQPEAAPSPRDFS